MCLTMVSIAVLIIILILVPRISTSDLAACCQRSHLPEDIFHCANRSVTRQYNAFVDRTASERAQPSLTIALLTRMTPSVVNYSAYSYLVHAKYAERNGYVLLPLWSDSNESDYAYHRKLVPIIDTLHDLTLDADYVAWFDAGM